MRHKDKAKDGDEKFLPSLKKKLFVAAAYLAVSAALLALVSYGQYKISIQGTLEMPAAAGFYATLTLSEDLEDNRATGSATLQDYLTCLSPGESAGTYASNPQTYVTGSSSYATALASRCIHVSVQNAQNTYGVSQASLKYTLRIYQEGRLPLQFVMNYMVGGASQATYVSRYDSAAGAYRFYQVDDASESASVETEFTFQPGEDATHQYDIYVGWDNTGTSPDDIASLTDMTYRKELAELEVRAEIINTPAGMSAVSQEELQRETRIRGATTYSTLDASAPDAVGDG